MASDTCIVCGTDLSGHARPALDAAVAIAARTAGELWVVHAVEPGAVGAGAARDEERRIAAWRGEVRLPDGAARVRDAALAGEPAAALCELAAARRASVLVVSSQGHGAEPIYQLGGTSERVAVESPVPVLVVRDAAPFTRWSQGESPLRALLAVDFTDSSDPAIRFARFLRAAGPVDVTVTHVYHPGASSRYGLEPLEVSAEPGGSLEALLARDLARRVGDLGGQGAVAIRPFLGAGRIGDHVLEAAREARADLVVLGSRGKRAYRRIASVSGVVLHHGRTSVACAPRAPGDGASG